MVNQFKVSVVIPSFNRAHLIEQILPSYFQPEVGEVILVDDCSTDNTEEVMRTLQQRFPTLQYIRQSKNQKQAAAKNAGILAARYPYVYFGDDDSFITPGCISQLLAPIESGMADIVGAKAIYMDPHEEVSQLHSIIERRKRVGNPIGNINKLQIDFTWDTPCLQAVALVQACFMISTENARSIKFDQHLYTGNGYREETDFLVRAADLGLRIFYQPAAFQINLPRIQSTGGSRSSNRWRYEISTLRNNWAFLKKNEAALRSKFGLTWPLWVVQAYFSLSRSNYLAMALAQTVFPNLYNSLRRLKARMGRKAL